MRPIFSSLLFLFALTGCTASPTSSPPSGGNEDAARPEEPAPEPEPEPAPVPPGDETPTESAHSEYDGLWSVNTMFLPGQQFTGSPGSMWFWVIDGRPYCVVVTNPFREAQAATPITESNGELNVSFRTEIEGTWAEDYSEFAGDTVVEYRIVGHLLSDNESGEVYQVSVEEIYAPSGIRMYSDGTMERFGGPYTREPFVCEGPENAPDTL